MQANFNKTFLTSLELKNEPNKLRSNIKLGLKGWGKHSSLLSSFVSYEENEVLQICPPHKLECVPWQTVPAKCSVSLKLILPIHKLWRK
jgi:hypothetical protein